jgi:hypothetical protein
MAHIYQMATDCARYVAGAYKTYFITDLLSFSYHVTTMSLRALRQMPVGRCRDAHFASLIMLEKPFWGLGF